MTAQSYSLDGPREFTFPHPVRRPEQLTLEVRPGGVVQPTEYQIIGAGPSATSVTVRWPNAPVDGTAELIVSRFTDPDRLAQFEEDVRVTARGLNAEFDNVYQALGDITDPLRDLYTRSSLAESIGQVAASDGDRMVLRDIAEIDPGTFVFGSSALRDIGTSPAQVPDNDAINSRGFAESVASVAELRAMTVGPTLERIWLEGYYGQGTPGGGPLLIDRDDTTSEDNGGTVFVTADGVRVKRSGEEPRPASHFGATDLAGPEFEAWVDEATGFLALNTSNTLPAWRTVRVPTDYATPAEALEAEMRWNPGGKSIIVLLESGYQIPEMTHSTRGDYSHIEIQSEDAVVELADGFSGESAWKFETCFAPRINVLVDCRGLNSLSGTRYTTAFAYIAPGKGTINSGNRGLESVSSFLRAEGSVFDGAAGRGIRISNSGMAQLRACSAVGSGESALAVAGACSVNANFAILTGAAGDGVELSSNCSVSLNDADLRNNAGSGIFATRNSRFDAANADTRGNALHGIRVEQGASGSAANATISDESSPTGSGTLNAAVFAFGGDVHVEGATITHAPRNLQSTWAGKINAQGGTVNSATDVDLQVNNGGEIQARNTGYSTSNIDIFNLPTPNGIIWDSDKTGFNVAHGSGAQGGAGSAGAGNQYVEITVAGTTYKVLHDGII